MEIILEGVRWAWQVPTGALVCLEEASWSRPNSEFRQAARSSWCSLDPGHRSNPHCEAEHTGGNPAVRTCVSVPPTYYLACSCVILSFFVIFSFFFTVNHVYVKMKWITNETIFTCLVRECGAVFYRRHTFYTFRVPKKKRDVRYEYDIWASIQAWFACKCIILYCPRVKKFLFRNEVHWMIFVSQQRQVSYQLIIFVRKLFFLLINDIYGNLRLDHREELRVVCASIEIFYLYYNCLTSCAGVTCHARREFFLSQNCNIFSILNIFKYNQIHRQNK